MMMIATCTTWYVRVSLEYCAVALYLIHCTIELVPTLHGVYTYVLSSGLESALHDQYINTLSRPCVTLHSITSSVHYSRIHS